MTLSSLEVTNSIFVFMSSNFQILFFLIFRIIFGRTCYGTTVSIYSSLLVRILGATCYQSSYTIKTLNYLLLYTLQLLVASLSHVGILVTGR